MLFEEQIARKPDLYPWTQQFVEAMQDGFWTHRRFKFGTDLHDFQTKLTEQERQIIVRSLSTIGQLEISVKKFWSKLGDNLPHPSINDLGHVMAYIEVIHGNAYERLLEVLGLNDSFDEILKEDIIKGRVNYLRKHLHKFHSDNKKQFIYSLILFTLFVENIALFSQFYAVSWFERHRHCLKDTAKQVEYTSREENIHALVGIKIINVLRKEYPELFDQELEEKVLQEATQAVKYECEIIDWIINGYDDEHLNAPLLKNFIQNRLNESLAQIGYTTAFEVDAKLLEKTQWFEEQVLGNNKTDFFHTDPVEYSEGAQSFSDDALFN